MDLRSLQGYLRGYALYYTVLFLMYVIILGVILFHLGAVHRRRPRRPTVRQRAVARDRARTTTRIPPPVLQVLLQDPYPLSFLEMWVLQSALREMGGTIATVADGHVTVDVDVHSRMDARTVRDLMSQRFKNATIECRTCGASSSRTARSRGGAIVYSLFGANDRRTGGVDRHARDLRRRAGDSGVVVARVILRDRADRDAVLAQFEEHFEHVQYGFVNYALLCCVHWITLCRLLWYETKSGWSRAQPESVVTSAPRSVGEEEGGGTPLTARAEWLRYGQLIIVARERMPGAEK